MTTIFAIGFVAAFAVLLCILGSFADALPEWVFMLQTRYYKKKQHRRRKNAK